MLREEAPIPNNIKFELGPYCLHCTPTGYKCICNNEELDWDGTVVIYHPVPQAEIKQSWFLPEKARMTPQEDIMPNSPRSERTLAMSECMESDWDADLDHVPDYPSRPYNDCTKPRPLKRHNLTIWKPPQGWPKYRSEAVPCTPINSPEYILMISSPPPPSPVI